jgi:hypothetical protein
MNNDELYFEQIKIYEEIARRRVKKIYILTSAFFCGILLLTYLLMR